VLHSIGLAEGEIMSDKSAHADKKLHDRDQHLYLFSEQAKDGLCKTLID
jgi:hypothetical protein